MSPLLQQQGSQDGVRWETLHCSGGGSGLQLGPDRPLLHHLQEQSDDRGQTKGHTRSCHQCVKFIAFLFFPSVNLQSLFRQEAKKVTIDKDLTNILSETPGRCVPYAVIEGAFSHPVSAEYTLIYTIKSCIFITIVPHLVCTCRTLQVP